MLTNLHTLVVAAVTSLMMALPAVRPTGGGANPFLR
jgi:hypothetical protein